MIKSILLGVGIMLGMLAGIAVAAFSLFYACGYALHVLGFVGASTEDILFAGMPCTFVIFFLVIFVIGSYQIGAEWRGRDD